MIPAYSPSTDTEYPSWDDLVAAEANGYAVVAIVTRPDSAPYARTTGPFRDQKTARAQAARLRRRWNSAPGVGFLYGSRLSVRVEPLWKDLAALLP